MAEKLEHYGLLAEFESPGDLIEAARKVRDAGYRRWDTHSPFPVHGLERAMGLRDSRLPLFTLVAGIGGTSTAILMQWWMNARDYPLLVSGKPLFSLPANIPVAFEMTVLFAALATVAGLFFLSDLPKFYHPAFRSRRFRRVTSDGFFITIEAADERYDEQRTEQLLREAGCVSLERLEG